MNFVYNDYVYDDNFLIKLNDSLKDIHAFNYNKFLNHKVNGLSILDFIYKLDRVVTYDENLPKEIGSKKLSLTEQKNLLILDQYLQQLKHSNNQLLKN